MLFLKKHRLCKFNIYKKKTQQKRKWIRCPMDSMHMGIPWYRILRRIRRHGPVPSPHLLKPLAKIGIPEFLGFAS